MTMDDVTRNAAVAADALRDAGYGVDVGIGMLSPDTGPRIDLSVVIGDPTTLHERYLFLFSPRRPTGTNPSWPGFHSTGTIGPPDGPRTPFRNVRETAVLLTEIVTEAVR
jgi:hypothetical protein